MRKQAESDLAVSLEGAWGLPVELTAPDGAVQTTSANDTDSLLMGQVLYSSFDTDPDTGAPILVEKPVVSLRLSSLVRVPLAGERWFIRIPNRPDPDADKESYVLSADKAPFRNDSIGYIKLYPQRIVQT